MLHTHGCDTATSQNTSRSEHTLTWNKYFVWISNIIDNICQEFFFFFQVKCVNQIKQPCQDPFSFFILRSDIKPGQFHFPPTTVHYNTWISSRMLSLWGKHFIVIIFSSCTSPSDLWYCVVSSFPLHRSGTLLGFLSLHCHCSFSSFSVAQFPFPTQSAHFSLCSHDLTGRNVIGTLELSC